MPHADPKHIQMLVLDVDGVLTDGSIWIGPDGAETKRFNVRDGLGMKVWMKLGYQLAIISGRFSESVVHRTRELGVELVYQDVHDKVKALHDLRDRTGLSPTVMAYIGDDWPDVPVLRRVGYPITVPEADRAVKSLAAYVTGRAGGHGAVRDAIDHLLIAKGTKDAHRTDETDPDAQVPLDDTPSGEIFPSA